jgi:hypothetical protein
MRQGKYPQFFCKQQANTLVRIVVLVPICVKLPVPLIAPTNVKEKLSEIQ